MTDEEYQQVIERQDGFAEKVQASYNKMQSIYYEMLEILKKIPAGEIYKKYFPDYESVKNPLEILYRLIQFRTENPEKAELLSSELNSFPDYKEYLKKLQKYDEIKYEYYFKVFSYYKMINNDRKELFAEEYMNTVDSLADRGIFTYYQQTPDLPLDGKTVDEAEQFILDYYSKNNCAALYYSFEKVFNQKSQNPLQINKTNDLAEALICLRFGAYQSCARTMFALLDNENKNASSLYSRSNGKERAEAIDNYVKDMGIEYYSKVWDKVNSYYKLLNCDTDDMDEANVNRHDLMHGTYQHIATRNDCIKLILLYATFKELSFYLQKVFDFQNEFKQDTLIYLVKLIEKSSK